MYFFFLILKIAEQEYILPFLKSLYNPYPVVMNKVPSFRKSRNIGYDDAPKLTTVLTVWEVLFHALIFPPPTSTM